MKDIVKSNKSLLFSRTIKYTDVFLLNKVFEVVSHRPYSSVPTKPVFLSNLNISSKNTSHSSFLRFYTGIPKKLSNIKKSVHFKYWSKLNSI